MIDSFLNRNRQTFNIVDHCKPFYAYLPLCALNRSSSARRPSYLSRFYHLENLWVILQDYHLPSLRALEDESTPYKLDDPGLLCALVLTVAVSDLEGDLEFMLSRSDSVSLESLSSTSSTRSDAESTPPDFEGILDRISNEYTHWLLQSGRELPPEWTMLDLVRVVISDDHIERLSNK
ncbi:hypothetical protein Salat_2358200 [Sesamum alatum]|uniref:Uncharacterized protein n=1 Tax=Sesamum alatum TaxID=300844 RepID=A0AAE1XWK4_9LAMI|nr:hypothetical protein Salat_2358200 [Sesamum alatum]